MLVHHLEISKRTYNYHRYRNKYKIDPTANFNGPEIDLYGNGDIIMGKESYIGRNSSIQATKCNTVTIGSNCALSHYIRIYTSNRIADQDFSVGTKYQQGDVTIGNYSWIGAFAFLTEGTTIGENSVIGAHSVVTQDIPPHSIAVGSPARVIKFKNYIDKSEREELMEQYQTVISSDLEE